MSFQKFIGIPFSRHSDLLEAEKGLKQATDALVKNEKTQEFLQRKQEYKEKEEDIPKTLNKEIPTKATTLLPPPSLRKRKSPVKKVNNFAFPITKRFHDGQKRKPRQKKVVPPK